MPPGSWTSRLNRPRIWSLADRDFTVLIRALGGLVIVGASLALALQQLRGAWIEPFVRQNVLGGERRMRILVSMAAGALGGLCVSLGALSVGEPPAGLARLSRWARLLAPLALVGVIPSLLTIAAWPDAMVLCFVLTVTILILEPLWRLHFRAYQAQPGWLVRRGQAVLARVPASVRAASPVVALGLMVLGYAVYMSVFTVRAHFRFDTWTWDLGQYDNTFYNALHGRPFVTTPLFRGAASWSSLQDHAFFLMFPLLPFYAIHPAAETLLVMQAVLLALGAIPLYRIAARRLSRGTALVLVGAYLLYPPLHGSQMFDVHFQPIAIPFVLAALDFFDARRMKLFALFFVLALSCREDIPVGFAILGLALLVSGHRQRAGAVIFAVSAAYFVAIRFFIMPAFGTWGHADPYKGLFPEGVPTFGGVILTMLSNPVFTVKTMITSDKLRYLLQIVLPLAFLPLRRWRLAVSLAPGIIFTVLTTDAGPMLDIGFHYSAHFIPYIFPAAVLALVALERETEGLGPAEGRVRRRAAVATLIVATILTTANWGAIPPRERYHSSYGWTTFKAPTAEQRAARRNLRQMIASIPPEAILAITDRELPHASNRTHCWNLSVGFEGSDYIIYTTSHPIAPETQQFEAALRAGYVRVTERPGLVLLRRPGAPVLGASAAARG